MIEVRDLHVRRGDKTIIDGCSFAVHSSGVLVILGANGVGKTTLLNTMIGVLKPYRGHMEIGGKIGFVPQLFEVAFSYSVMDIALMGRVRHIGLFGSPGTRDFAVVRRFLALLGIEDLENRVFNELSGGQRQMVMIAQALSSECDILILDEPCAALDYRNQKVVIDVLRSLSRDHGITIVFTTHVPQHAVEIASHVLLMNSAVSYLSGTAETVLSESNLSALYKVPIGRAQFAGSGKFTYAPLFHHEEVRHEP